MIEESKSTIMMGEGEFNTSRIMQSMNDTTNFDARSDESDTNIKRKSTINSKLNSANTSFMSQGRIKRTSNVQTKKKVIQIQLDDDDDSFISDTDIRANRRHQIGE